LEINRTKFYLHSFRFDVFIVRCLGDSFFPDTVYIHFVAIYSWSLHRSRKSQEKSLKPLF